MSLFTELEYSYKSITEQKLNKQYLDVDYLSDILNLRNKVIRINVTDRSNAKHYSQFVKALRSVECVNYSIIDTTQVTELEVKEISAKDFNISPIEILLDKINEMEYIDYEDDKEVRYEAIGNKLKSVYDKCQSENNLV
jgi:ribosomal protein L20